jgi:hypothetical protein
MLYMQCVGAVQACVWCGNGAADPQDPRSTHTKPMSHVWHLDTYVAGKPHIVTPILMLGVRLHGPYNVNYIILRSYISMFYSAKVVRVVESKGNDNVIHKE